MSDDAGSARPADASKPPPEGPVTAPEPAATPPRWWRDRRLLAGGAVVAILMVAAVVLVPGPDGPGAREELAVGPLAVPKAGRDLVPRAPVVQKIPDACGVPDATARELMPGADPDDWSKGIADDSQQECHWYGGDGLSDDRELHVRIRLFDPSDQASAVGLAMFPADGQWYYDSGSETTRIVTGLGGEARAGYSPAQDAGASVRFRVANVAVSLNHQGGNRASKDPLKRQLPEKTAMPGALKAAAAIAKNLGVPTPSTPGFALPEATPAPIRHAPKPCDTVSAETLRKVADGAYREGGGTAPLVHDTPSLELASPDIRWDTCRWHARTPASDSPDTKDSRRQVAVTIAAATERQPGAAVLLAARLYLRQHYDARDSAPGPASRRHGFMALSAPGDQAFAEYGEPGETADPAGRVVFRLGNVVVQVRYADARASNEYDDDPLTNTEAVNGAYTVALDVARSLRRP